MAQYIFPIGATTDFWWKEISTDGYIVVGNLSGSAQNGTVRFPGVTIPQGTTIDSARVLLYKQSSAVSGSVNFRIRGIDEDDTASFTGDPYGRPATTAETTGSTTANVTNVYVGFDVTSSVNEILARGGWSSGNAMGFFFDDNGTTTANARITDIYDGVESTDAYLEINWDQPSESRSPSASPSRSPSRSASQTPSPSFPVEPFFGLKVAKPGHNVLTTVEPKDLIFSSDYGTLKYYTKETAQITFDGDLAIAGSTTITHDLGYYPFVEVFVDVYIGTSEGTYEYVPFAGSGATISYDATYKITTTGVTLYAQINGISSEVWVFDFIVFIYKNDLHL